MRSLGRRRLSHADAYLLERANRFYSVAAECRVTANAASDPDLVTSLKNAASELETSASMIRRSLGL